MGFIENLVRLASEAAASAGHLTTALTSDLPKPTLVALSDNYALHQNCQRGGTPGSG